MPQHGLLCARLRAVERSAPEKQALVLFPWVM
jgi:hypothetical protein